MKNPIWGNSIIVAAEGQVSCDLAGEAVILDLKSGEYYGLNPVGARIWNLVQEPHTVSEVLSVIVEEYDVAPDRCEQDLLALVEELAAKGLIEVRNGTAA
jgi:hypothetical protein